jgi:hypothetical protein
MEFQFAIPQPLEADFDGFFDLTGDGLADEELLSVDHVIEGTMNTSRFSQADLDIESLPQNSIPIEFTTQETGPGFPEARVHSLSLF